MTYLQERISPSCLKKLMSALFILTVIIFVSLYTHLLELLKAPESGKNTVQTLEHSRLSWLFQEEEPPKTSTKNFKFDLNELSKDEYKQADDEVFQSPYVVTHKNYPESETVKPLNSSRKLKVVACFNCPEWFISNVMSTFKSDQKLCPFSGCIVDHKVRSDTADVVLFFVGQIGKAKVPPRPPGQIWVKSYWESPVHYDYPTPYEPWKNVFNWTMTYRTDSDIFSPVNRLVLRNRGPLSDEMYLAIAKNKTKMAAWFVSNCGGQSKRIEYVREMQKYINVDIYGECGTLSCKRSEMEACESRLNTTYKFYLGFENSFCKDYVTEKLFRVFQYNSHVIPVVRGGFDYNRYIPKGTFINTASFSSPKELALYLKDLGNDHLRYARMLKEKDRFTTFNVRIDWCEFCEKVHTATESKIIPDIRMWSHNGTCHPPNDINY